MCGIVAVLRRPSARPVPSGDELLDLLDDALAAAEPGAGTRHGADLAAGLASAAALVAGVDGQLRGVPGLLALLDQRALAAALESRLEGLVRVVERVEGELDASSEDEGDSGGPSLLDDTLEEVNAALVALKDATWAVARDRLPAARGVAALAGAGEGGARPSAAALGAYLSIHMALSAIDRLEVRGRDSAGLHVLVDGHGLDLASPDVAAAVEARADDLFPGQAVRVADGALSFVYKAAAEIGELGDNTAVLRRAVAGDDLLRRALAADGAQADVLGHTRWASVGLISEPNAHPVNSDERPATGGPYVVAALNGDVDNYAELAAAAGLGLPAEITTDAKVIPALLSRRLDGSLPPEEAFRRTAAEFEGSVAVVASVAAAPGRLLLAQRGSGQALYVGVGEDTYVVASEPYGLVEETARYLRLDGEGAGGAGGEPGQVVAIDRHRAGSVEDVRRWSYDGTEIPVAAADLAVAEITTRDLDRAGAPHFLVKEIGAAPRSIRMTLRSKLERERGLLSVRLPEGTLPPDLAGRLAGGDLRRIVVTGQGTAAVAGQAVAAAMTGALEGTGVVVTSATAAELSGFGLSDDMSDALVVAVSQSGTSTDTNRTVDLVRARGATVVAVVNRRSSDLCDKADGVLYTSDGRDVEMAVPSTKAFYAQVAAGFLLAWGLARAAGVGDRHRAGELLAALRRLPAAMEQVLARRPAIAAAAQRHSLSRRHWAVVGSGPNRMAAAELRIKLSELCYKSIACDVTEDKKHIDLSSEPLVLVCAAGLDAANASDVAKEIAIFRAHRAAPVVIASDGEHRFDAAVDVLYVPSVHPGLDFVLTAMAGHLFGYEAAAAIDGQARRLRQLRGAVEEAAAPSWGPDPDEGLLARVAAATSGPAERFFAELRSGELDGNLSARAAVRLASILDVARGATPLEAYELEYGRAGSPGALVDDLLVVLTEAIDELTRPIDAIKHQAKTVTVGISRAEESYASVPLVREVLAAGAGRERVGYRALRTLAGLDPAVSAVTGFSRYQVEGDVTGGTATIHRVDSGGVARDLPSRTDTDPALKGTKRRAAFEREVTVSRSSHDARTTVIVPETKDNQVTGITLVHVEVRDRLGAAEARRVLTGYRNRYNALVDAVTETEPAFDDEVLAEVPMVDLLVEPVHVLARRWRRG